MFFFSVRDLWYNLWLWENPRITRCRAVQRVGVVNELVKVMVCLWVFFVLIILCSQDV